MREVENFPAIAPPQVIILGNSRRAGNATQERAWTHRSTNLELAEVIGEIEKTVDEFDARHIFADVNSVTGRFLDVSHAVHSPSLNTTERFEIGQQAASLIKPVTGRVNLPTPANDNGGDTMPLEEAA